MKAVSKIRKNGRRGKEVTYLGCHEEPFSALSIGASRMMLMRSSPVFYMGEEMSLTFDGGELRVQHESIVGMAQTGVLHLPYEICIFEAPQTLDDGKELAVVTLASECEQFIQAEFIVVMSNEKGGAIPVAVQCDKFTGETFTGIIRVRPEGAEESRELNLVPRWRGKEMTREGWDSWAMQMWGTVEKAIILMHTRGVEVRQESKLHGGKAKLRRRDAAEYDYHRITIPGLRDGDGTGVAVGERKRVRLHLRRGHVRSQPFGKGKVRRRQKWIEPMLVGYQEEGEVFKDYVVEN
jgi:hypothetical protein